MQIDIPFFAYILRDTYTLSNYDSGKVTPLSEIRRRLLDSSRSFNPYLPDYIYENRYRHENEVPDKSYIENLGSFITNGFVSLANKYLSSNPQLSSSASFLRLNVLSSLN